MKCRICGKQVTYTQVKLGEAIRVNYKKVNIYFCSEKHCGDFFKVENEKAKNNKLLDDIDKFAKNELEYFNKMPILPTALFTRINDLRNGTRRNAFGEIKNGTDDGYPYEVILQTFIECKDKINYAIINKLGNAKESQKINYIMTIIEGNINNIYSRWLRNRKEVILNIEPTDYELTKNKSINNKESLFDENDLL